MKINDKVDQPEKSQKIFGKTTCLKNILLLNWIYLVFCGYVILCSGTSRLIFFPIKDEYYFSLDSSIALICGTIVVTSLSVVVLHKVLMSGKGEKEA